MINDAGVSQQPFALWLRLAEALSSAARIAAAAILFAAAALGSLAANASADPQTEGSLLDALGTTSDENKRLDILYALSAYRSDAVRVALEGIAGDTAEPPSVRMQAICSLAGSATADSVPLLIGITETDLKERRGYWGCTIPVLGQIGDRRAMPVLLRIARLKEEHLAGMDDMAITAIAGMADERDVPFLMSVAYFVAVRPAVIAALARIASPASCEVLIGGLQDGEAPETVAAAERGLKTIGRAAIPWLKAALDQPMDSVFKGRVAKLLAAIR